MPKRTDIQKILVIGYFKNNGENISLGVVKIHNTAEKKRTHFRNCGSKRHPLFTVYIPENGRIAMEIIILKSQIV